LRQITARCEEIDVTWSLVRQFADMLCGRHGHNLPAWTALAEASPVRELRSFAAGLRKDWAAVTAGLTLPYSSGPVEGHVNRIKMIKREMYGRSSPPALPRLCRSRDHASSASSLREMNVNRGVQRSAMGHAPMGLAAGDRGHVAVAWRA
jgi:hypothetical protein